MSLPKTFETEKEAVYHAMLLWEYLKNNPEKDKRDYLEVNGVEDLYAEYWQGDCPCCEYYIQPNKELCEGCLLNVPELCHLNLQGSAYDLWNQVSDRRAKYAEIIYNALADKYKELCSEAY